MTLAAIVVAAILEAGPAASGLDPRQVECVARAVYHEARGEPEAGKIFVARVVMSRAGLRGFPPTPCRVVRQAGAFPWHLARKPVRERDAFRVAARVAVETMIAVDDAPVATHFYAPALVTPFWAPVFVEVATVGGHRFMLDPGARP